MKYRNKYYISIDSLPWIILPIIALTALTCYALSDTFHSKPMDLYPAPRTELKGDDNFPIDTPEFQTGDEALFNFTGDTVLVLSQPESLTESGEEVEVLHKTPQGNLETVDLPENWLLKLPTDTLPD